MNEDNLPRAIKKLVSFAVFTIGILTLLFGVYLIIDSFAYNHAYKIEGGMISLLGIICMYLSDQSILNTQRNDMLKQMIKENKILSQRQKGSGGILESLMGGLGMANNPLSSIKIIQGTPEELEDEIRNFSSHVRKENTSDPEFKKEVKEMMVKTNLDEEDASLALLLTTKSLEEMKLAKEEAISKDKFELAAFIQKMIDERNSSDNATNS